MKKSVIMLISIVYIASIVVINFFGLKMSVYNVFVPVSQVECTNSEDLQRFPNIKVDSSYFDGKNTYDKQIRFKLSGAASKENPDKLTITHRVYPDNASQKEVRYVYSQSSSNFQFHKDENGRETGMILIYGKCLINLIIVSADGRGAQTNIMISVY